MAQGEFIEAYAGNREEVVELALGADCVADAIISFINEKGGWEGTATELHLELEKFIPEQLKKLRIWPKAANALSTRLRRAATFLRAKKIDIDFGERKPGTGKKIIKIRIREEKTVTTVTPSQNTIQLSEKMNQEFCDDRVTIPSTVTIDREKSSQNNSIKNNDVTMRDDCDEKFSSFSKNPESELREGVI